MKQQLALWQTNPDLASVRDKDALDRLPDNEQREWSKPRVEVAALKRKVEEKK